MAKVLVLPIKDIEENPQALRTTVDKEGLSYIELKSGIQNVGLLNPISVREVPSEDGESFTYRLVDGLHRLTALQELGYTEVPVNVVTIDESKLLVAQIIGNNNVKTTRSQFAQGLKQLIQHQALSKKEVAKMVSKSEKWVDEQLGLLDLPEAVQKLVDDGKVCVMNALSLRKVKDRIDDFIQAAMTETPDIFGPKVEEFLKESKAAALGGRKVVVEFKPTARPRKTSELKNSLSEVEQTGSVSELKVLIETQGITDPVLAAIETLKWFLHLDPVSVAAERAKWDAEVAAKKVAADKRATEREAKKQAQAAAEVANHVAG